MLRMNLPPMPGHAEVFLEYDALLSMADGRALRARACGGEAHDGTNRWHGWIELFWRQGEGLPVVPRGRQPSQTGRAPSYWSTGLTHVSLGRGARARAPLRTAPPAQPEAILRGRGHPTMAEVKAGITIILRCTGVPVRGGCPSCGHQHPRTCSVAP